MHPYCSWNIYESWNDRSDYSQLILTRDFFLSLNYVSACKQKPIIGPRKNTLNKIRADPSLKSLDNSLDIKIQWSVLNKIAIQAKSHLSSSVYW